MSYQIDTLRKVLTAARPDMTGDQRDAADALLAALTPPMEEPTWPAWVMAGCGWNSSAHLHQRSLDPQPRWECDTDFSAWHHLRDPRPLTDEERAEYGIPGECERPHAEPITDELVERCIEASTFMYPAWVRAVLRAAGHPEAGE